MYDFLLTPEACDLKKEARRFVKDEVCADFLRKMDKDEIVYPREFVMKLARNGLLGIRFPGKYGGRDMDWTAEVAVIEEIGCLGVALGCAYVMPSIVARRCMYSERRNRKKPISSPI